MRQLVIAYDPETKFCELYHPYDKRFVAFVSQGIKPISCRYFDHAARRWRVHASKLPQIVAAAKRFFDHVDYRAVPPDIQIKIVQFAENGGDDPVPTFSIKPKMSPYAVLFVTTNAPPEVIKAAYRALAQKHHPDHGGDPEKFREIDEAYKTLTNGKIS